MAGRRPVLVIGSVLLLVLMTVGEAGAAVLYRLDQRGTFQQGCFPPCMCPLMESTSLEGSFELALVSVGDVFDFYSVEAVRWLAPGPSLDHSVRGSGSYKVSTIIGENEMSLDLAVDQNTPEHYTSDTVPLHAVFPEIDVAISKNGGVCIDTVMEVVARPTPRLFLDARGASWDSGLEVPGYDLVRGSLSVLRATRGRFDLAIDACLADDLHEHTLELRANPAAGDGFFLLARAGGSTYDTGLASQVRSRDPGIAASPFSCP